MNRLKEDLIYIVINAVASFALPFLMRDTGSAMVVLLILLPLVYFTVSLIQGYHHGVHVLYCALIPVMFIPVVLLRMNSSANIYPAAYFVVGLIGSVIGQVLGKKSKS